MRAWLQCNVRHGREGGLHRAKGRKNQLVLPRGEGNVSQRRWVFKDRSILSTVVSLFSKCFDEKLYKLYVTLKFSGIFILTEE